MKKEELRNTFAELLDVPDETLGALHIEISSNREIFIGNHKGILELNSDGVSVNSGDGVIKVVGGNMRVSAMNSDEIRLVGNIESVSFER